jgi:hypothetical protein
MIKMTGEIYSRNLTLENMSELKAMLVSVLATLQESKERYETSHRELENKLEISYKKLENKLEARDRESREKHEALLNKLEISHKNLKNGLDTSHRKTLAIFDKAVESFKITSPQIGDR